MWFRHNGLKVEPTTENIQKWAIKSGWNDFKVGDIRILKGSK